MLRRQVNPMVEVQQLLVHTDTTPYAMVADLVRDFLTNATHSPQNTEHALEILRYVPKRADRALQFDHSLIQALAGELLGRFDMDGPKPIMPTYGPEWTHRTLLVPQIDGRLLTLTGLGIKRDEGSAPHLDQYMWLVHEVVHFVFGFLHEDPIGRQVEEKLLQVRRELAYAAFPLRGVASATAAVADEVRQRWTARKDQLDWSHELAVDAICLWVLGPAYVDALTAAYDRLLNQDVLYRIEQSHPPVELRLCALLEGACALGWVNECAKLDQLYRSALMVHIDAALGNRYAALRRMDLIATVRAAAWRFCENAGLPLLTRDRLNTLHTHLAAPETLSGLTLVLTGWLKAKEAEATHDVEGFDAWVHSLLQRPEYDP